MGSLYRQLSIAQFFVLFRDLHLDFSHIFVMDMLLLVAVLLRQKVGLLFLVCQFTVLNTPGAFIRRAAVALEPCLVSLGTGISHDMLALNLAVINILMAFLGTCMYPANEHCRAVE